MSWLIKIKEMVVGPGVKEDLLREKRAAPRIHCFIDASFTTDEHDVLTGNIISLEATGMRLITPMKLAKGQKFDVSISSYSAPSLEKNYEHETVNAEVVWCRKKAGFSLYYTGVRFIDPDEIVRNSWVHFVLDSYGVAAESHSQRRKDIRIATTLPVICYYLDKKGEKSHLSGLAYDMSLGGVKVNLVREIPSGLEVTLHLGPYGKLPVLKCKGKVRRSSFSNKIEEYTVGVEFIELDEEQMKQLGDYIMALLREVSL